MKYISTESIDEILEERDANDQCGWLWCGRFISADTIAKKQAEAKMQSFPEEGKLAQYFHQDGESINSQLKYKYTFCTPKCRSMHTELLRGEIDGFDLNTLNSASQIDTDGMKFMADYTDLKDGYLSFLNAVDSYRAQCGIAKAKINSKRVPKTVQVNKDGKVIKPSLKSGIEGIKAGVEQK